MAIGNPSYDPITQGGSVPDLWAHSDFGESTYRGDNPGMSFGQYHTPLLGSRITSQLLFGNKLVGQKQKAINNLLANFQPGNIQANADRIRQKGINSAMSSAPDIDFTMQSLGLSPGARAGAVRGGFNRATEAGNEYQSRMFSPEGQTDALAAILGAINAGSETDLPLFLQMLGLQTGDAQFRQQNKSGGVLGGFGDLIGMAMGGANPFGGLFGGGGGGGMNMDGSSSGWQQQVGPAR